MRRKKFGQILAAITMLFIIGNNINHKMCKVNGISMEPTLEDGDMIRMKRYSGSIKHGDVVAILSKDNHQYLIKRVIAYEKSYDSREIGCLNMKDIIAYKDIPQKDARK